MTVGQRIKNKREELGMSQGDLAKKMGISRQAISKAELHDDNITTDKVTKFALALGVTESFLMGWDEYIDSFADGWNDAELLAKFHNLIPDYQKLVLAQIDNLNDIQANVQRSLTDKK